jgi:hypothetical protein
MGEEILWDVQNKIAQDISEIQEIEGLVSLIFLKFFIASSNW